MGRIKSALEIALERTESVKSDKSSVGLFEAKQKGRRLANQYLAGELGSLEGEFKKTSGEEREALREGCFDALVSQITLPAVEDDLKRLETAGKGLAAVIDDKRFSTFYQRFLAAVSQYLNETARYEEALTRQYAPKLRQKEEELARRFGRAVKLDPFQDPEFAAFYNQNMNALKANYAGMADQTREQAKLLFEEKQPS
jgi:hypothetical protein